MSILSEGTARNAYSNIPGEVFQTPDNGELKIQQADGYLVTRKADGTSRNTPLDIGAARFRIGTDTAIPMPYLSQIAAGQTPSLDMFGAARNGVVGDEPLLNEILNGHNVCVVKPGGPVTVKSSPIIVPPNALLRGEGGRQNVRITRDVNYTGDTLHMGYQNGAGAGSAAVEGLWFDHPGRFVGVVPSDYALPNRLTSGQAHIQAFGVQGARIVDCGGWGMPHFIVHSGGSGLDIVRHMSLGGMWNPLIEAQQESLSVFHSTYNTRHGYSVNCNITNPNFVGGNTAAAAANFAVDNYSYTCLNPRIGPKHIYFLNCYEVLTISGGFSGGAAQSNFLIQGGGPPLINDKPAWVMLRLEINNHAIDESMVTGVELVRTDPNTAIATDVAFKGCFFSGQLVGSRGIQTSQGSLFAVQNLIVDGGTLVAYQGGAILLGAVDGGVIIPRRVRGYNYVGSDTSKGDLSQTGAGIWLGGITRNVLVGGPTVFGGGANADPDPNSCQWGLVDTTPSAQGNQYFALASHNLGIIGGGTVAGGTKLSA